MENESTIQTRNLIVEPWHKYEIVSKTSIIRYRRCVNCGVVEYDTPSGEMYYRASDSYSGSTSPECFRLNTKKTKSYPLKEKKQNPL